MFSRLERLQQRTPKDGIGRFEYLCQLVKEFNITVASSAKEQILANLANFAYDPINYEFLKTLRVVDIFLDQLSEKNSRLVQFAIGGLCNFSADPEIQIYIVQSGGVNNIASLLASDDEQIVLSALSTLLFLISPSTKDEILKQEIIEQVNALAYSQNKRFQNLATVFLSHNKSNESNSNTN